MKKLLAVMLILPTLAFAKDVKIISPITKNNVWVISTQPCQTNNKAGTIYQDGISIGCWGSDENNTFLFEVNGEMYSRTQAQIDGDIDKYNASRADIPWQTLVEIQRAFRQPQPTFVAPQTNTNFYNSSGQYIGRSSTW